MILTLEEKLILQKASRILQRLSAESIPNTEGANLYAVGNKNEEGSWGFIDGPDVYLNKMLQCVPEVINEKHSDFYIVLKD